MKQVLLYLPVLHAGYEQFPARHGDADEILLLGPGSGRTTPAWPRTSARCRRTGQPATCGSSCRGHTIRVVEPEDLAGRGHAATRLSCPTRRSHGTWPGGMTSARGAPCCSTGPSCAGTGTWATARVPVAFDGEITRHGPGPGAAGYRRGRLRAQFRLVAPGWRGRRPGRARFSAAPGTSTVPTEYAPYLDGDPTGRVRAGRAGRPVHRDPRRGGADRARGPGRALPSRAPTLHHDVPLPGLRAAHRRVPASRGVTSPGSTRFSTASSAAGRGNQPDMGGYRAGS